ncbi:MAG: GntR family transcriptional regulator [Shimia sp.]
MTERATPTAPTAPAPPMARGPIDVAAGGGAGRLPKHREIAALLMHEIASGRLPDGARLPTERALADRFGVAVGTLRRALHDLEAGGALRRVQGSGNYVRSGGVYGLFRLERAEGGGRPTARMLSAEAIARPAGLGTRGRGARVLRIRRLRLLDGLPVALEEVFLDAPGAAALRAEALSDALYLSFRIALGLSIDRTEDRVGLAHAPDWGPADGAPRPGAVCGHVARLGWAAGHGDGPVEASSTWFDAEAARFVSRAGLGTRIPHAPEAPT